MRRGGETLEYRVWRDDAHVQGSGGDFRIERTGAMYTKPRDHHQRSHWLHKHTCTSTHT